ncbi:hypothetical protein W02_05070 [Nitrospira sp. KM1]|nr:hypothetical protein W02_05070 [Nitrospira sp. KM1]
MVLPALLDGDAGSCMRDAPAQGGCYHENREKDFMSKLLTMNEAAGYLGVSKLTRMVGYQLIK